MKYSLLAAAVYKMTEIEPVYDKLIIDYKIKSGKKIIASPGYFIPPEINSAFDIVTLKVPEFIAGNPDFSERMVSLYDAVILSGRECCCDKKFMPYRADYIFPTPGGFGEDAAVSIHNEISAMLAALFNIELKTINIELLKKETSLYEKLRRTVRSICALRNENSLLLNNTELSLIFETALILPPETALEYITPVLAEMQKIDEKHNINYLPGMIYGGKKIPPAVADYIEDNGILIIEDDTCSGRRLFDISLNAESEFIFYEILDAYSYRPLSPCMRPVNERYELLYRLLKNYNINTVIFYSDEDCSDSVKDIDYLRIRMMRDGIDPLVIDKNNYREIVSGYLSRI